MARKTVTAKAEAPAVRGKGLTREAILDCASLVFAERGYRAANLLHVASRLGVTRQALYYHYARKHDILVALFHRMMDTLEAGAARIDETAPAPGERFSLLLENHAVIVAGNIELITILLCENAAFDKETFAVVQERRQRYQDILASAFQEGVKAGELRDVDPTLATNFLIGTMNSMFRWYHTGGGKSPKEVARFATDLLQQGYGTAVPAKRRRASQ